MHKAVTISAERARIGIQATYELEGSLDLLVRLANAEESGGERLDCAAVRGMAIRARELTRVLMSVVDDDVNEAGAHLTVFGEPQP